MQLTDMYPSKFLRGQDMTKPLLIELKSVEKTELRAGPGKPAEQGYVLHFENVHAATGKYQLVRGIAYTVGKGHVLVLRRALADQIMAATATTDTDEWPGKRVVIYPEAMNVAGRAVIAIRARAPKMNGANGAHSDAPQPEQPMKQSEAIPAADGRQVVAA
jgi:hypothetical protein